MAILIRDKNKHQDNLEQSYLSNFFIPDKHSQHEPGLYRRDQNTIIIDLSKLSNSTFFGNIETYKLYKEFGIDHYKIIGNNPTNPLFTKIDFMTYNGLSIEYDSPIKTSYIQLFSMYYKELKEIKGNVSLQFNNDLILNYDQLGFWRVDKKDLRSASEIYKHTGLAYQILRNYENFDEEVLKARLNSKIARRTAVLTLYEVLEEDTLYYFRYSDTLCFIIKNPKQSTYKYAGGNQGIQHLNINDFKEMGKFMVYIVKI